MKDIYLAADILWSYYPTVRNAHPFPRYRGQLINETRGEDGLLCYLGDYLVGALVISRLDWDSHFPGKGIIVHYSVTNPDHPKATRLLYRYLVNLIREKGGSWYQTTRRVSETEFHSKYRSIHNG